SGVPVGQGVGDDGVNGASSGVSVGQGAADDGANGVVSGASGGGPTEGAHVPGTLSTPGGGPTHVETKTSKASVGTTTPSIDQNKKQARHTISGGAQDIQGPGGHHVFSGGAQDVESVSTPLAHADRDVPDLKDIPDNINQMPLELFNNLTKADADKMRALELAKMAQYKSQAMRGELVDKDLVIKYFGLLYTVDTNQLKVLGSKLAPILAGIFEIEDDEKTLAATQTIDDEIIKILKSTKAIMDKFENETSN
ncbi:hypothetical protein KAR91_19635, partial [Candidatus Pacearchaeota archaeon]|nr:hypothetical protein [Candidatus Pacearchaeota archaeon]